MKRIFVLLLSLCVLCACGKNKVINNVREIEHPKVLQNNVDTREFNEKHPYLTKASIAVILVGMFWAIGECKKATKKLKKKQEAKAKAKAKQAGGNLT